MPSFTTTQPVTAADAVQIAGAKRLFQSVRNLDRVEKMSNYELAQQLLEMAGSEPVWTIRFDILCAAANIIAPELFADDLDDDDASAESGL